MIRISYYARYSGDWGAQISNSKPKGYRVRMECPALYPDWDMVKKFKAGTIDWKTFRRAYIKKLKKLDVAEWADKLQNYCLLCYEKNPEHCHRSILCEWFTRNGYDCKELPEINKGEK